MPRYIDAEQIPYHYLPIAAIGDMYATKSDIMKVPTANVREVQNGKWLRNNDSDADWKCSHCGYGYSDFRTTYCYDCGAEMDL